MVKTVAKRSKHLTGDVMEDIGDAVTIVNFLVGKAATLSRTIGVELDEREPQ